MFTENENHIVHGTSALKISQPRHSCTNASIIEVDFTQVALNRSRRHTPINWNSSEAVPACIRQGCLYNGLSREHLAGERIGRMSKAQSIVTGLFFTCLALGSVFIGI